MKAIENKQFSCPENKFGKCPLAFKNDAKNSTMYAMFCFYTSYNMIAIFFRFGICLFRFCKFRYPTVSC